jgi:hypothetical protein
VRLRRHLTKLRTARGISVSAASATPALAWLGVTRRIVLLEQPRLILLLSRLYSHVWIDAWILFFELLLNRRERLLLLGILGDCHGGGDGERDRG